MGSEVVIERRENGIGKGGGGNHIQFILHRGSDGLIGDDNLHD